MVGYLRAKRIPSLRNPAWLVLAGRDAGGCPFLTIYQWAVL